MTIDVGDGEFQAGPENAMLLAYPNDMMDGLFVDVDEERFCFIGADSENFAELKEAAISDGIPIGNVGEEADLTEYPHNLVIQSLGRFVVDAAEESLTMEERYLPMKPDWRELSVRDGYGVRVRLGWLMSSNSLEIHYIDENENVNTHFPVPNDQGNDAFYHPNKYRP